MELFDNLVKAKQDIVASRDATARVSARNILAVSDGNPVPQWLRQLPKGVVVLEPDYGNKPPRFYWELLDKQIFDYRTQPLFQKETESEDDSRAVEKYTE